MIKTSDLHVVETRTLIPPESLHQQFPLTETVGNLVSETRQRISNILQGNDQRLLVVVGPCSIHDTKAAHEYGQKLAWLREDLKDTLEIVMRVYFEKPRTTIGWKGMINDPDLDNTYKIDKGLKLARQLLLDLGEMGVPSATELLDPIIPQYLADLITWTAIGARTTESQTHREMASGLSMPVGFKNGTDGSLDSAINAMLAAQIPHHFLGINYQGLASIVTTTGNNDGHLVLRGGNQGTNYDKESLTTASEILRQKGLPYRVMVDCSHGNSQKDHNRQAEVLAELAQQVHKGLPHLMGVMIESHLKAGKQDIPEDLNQLVYGQSITDACVDFTTTTQMLHQLAEAVSSKVS